MMFPAVSNSANSGLGFKRETFGQGGFGKERKRKERECSHLSPSNENVPVVLNLNVPLRLRDGLVPREVGHGEVGGHLRKKGGRRKSATRERKRKGERRTEETSTSMINPRA